MLNHANPAVVGALRIRQLAIGVRRQLVKLAEFDFFELVVLVVDHRTGICSRCHRALHVRSLGVARELEVSIGCYNSAAGIGDVVGYRYHPVRCLSLWRSSPRWVLARSRRSAMRALPSGLAEP